MCGVLNCSTAKLLVLAFFSAGTQSFKKERIEKIEGCKPWLPMVFGTLTRVFQTLELGHLGLQMTSQIKKC